MRTSVRPISDPGRTCIAARRSAAAGFTLIEMLVVVVIAGIIVSLLTISATPNPERELRFEAERLAQLLALAREEAQVRGIPIRFDADGEAYRFLTVRDRQWQPIVDDPDLRERRWEQPTRVRIDRRDDRQALEFGRDSVEPPFVLWLTREGAQVQIAANGLGAFVVAQ